MSSIGLLLADVFLRLLLVKFASLIDARLH